MLKRIISTATLCAFLTAPAIAAVPVDFGGAYVGGSANFLNMDNTSTDTKTKFDFAGSLHGGYGKQTADGLYYGAEISDGTSAGVLKDAGYKYSTANDFAADVRFGKVVNETLAYGKVGYALTGIDTTNINTGATSSANFDGIRFGVGAERFVTEKVSARVEGVYTDYAAKTINDTQVDPSNLAFKIGVSYKLD